jgi:hypothetical protein
MNNILALGCSFTWGESLQFFSGLDSVLWEKDRPQFPDTLKTLDEKQLEFIYQNRWPAVLANKLNVEYITKSRNGGSNMESLNIATDFYNNPFNLENYKICVFQLTEFSRDPFIFKLPSGEILEEKDYSVVEYQRQVLGLDNEVILRDSYNYFYDKLYDFKTYLEENGVSVYIIAYPQQSVEVLKEHKLYSNFVTLKYDGNEYSSTDDLSLAHPMLVIENYFADRNLNKGDTHLVLEGHHIIANSIYNEIKKND